MSTISVMLQVGVPTHSTPTPAEKPQASVESAVREALDCIDSGHDSHVEWNMIRRLYRELNKRKKTPRITNLIQMMEPVLQKYGYHGVV